MSIAGKSKGDVVQQLENVYQVARSTVFNRLKYLGYSLDKVDGLCSLSDEQKAELDNLHRWISDGGKMADYPKPGQLTTIADGELEQYAESINFDALEGDEELGHAELIRAAQNQAAGILIAQNLLTAEMLKNPQHLPEDLLAQVEQSKVAIAPKPQNPLVIAGEWITKAKAYQQKPQIEAMEEAA
jgi:hypothetical protein